MAARISQYSLQEGVLLILMKFFMVVFSGELPQFEMEIRVLCKEENHPFRRHERATVLARLRLPVCLSMI